MSSVSIPKGPLEGNDRSPTVTELSHDEIDSRILRNSDLFRGALSRLRGEPQIAGNAYQAKPRTEQMVEVADSVRFLARQLASAGVQEPLSHLRRAFVKGGFISADQVDEVFDIYTRYNTEDEGGYVEE